jgi:hypothetical protein
VDAGASTWPKGERCDGADANGEDKMSLSFLFFLFFGETVYVDEGIRFVGRYAAQLAASGLTRGGALVLQN